MSGAFDRLHPALQHHVVNSLGWRSLRPLQEAAIDPVAAGEHALLVAPTAGGKTEAAMFPVLSRMLSEDWRGVSVVYVCPIKALLNNLEPRLQRYAGLLGRRVGLWHGDVSDGERRRVVRDQPDILLTTPESLEVMLLFRHDERHALFGRLRVLVVDELHAFAGDDRGWHLLSVANRVQRVAKRELQRVGLSATVGNPEELLAWLAAGASGPRRVVAPPAGELAPPDLQMDHVGTLENAGLVISRLHRGEKRLVFVDSRSRVELLAADLRERDVSVFVSHSSLSLDERRRAEEAFSSAQDCVIVATSTLELGVDVGDLDRVIQVDAPWTVASLLQRVGRTGRRAGTRRNGLFLTTDDDSFLRAAGILQLVADGFVEPVQPPPLPLHVFAHQMLALAKQEGRIPQDEWRLWIGAVPAFASLSADDVAAVLEHMVSTGYLTRESGLLSFGPAAEERFKGPRVLDLCAVFSSPPLFKVLHGREELGEVHESTFQAAEEGRRAVLLLAGRNWAVTDLDWDRRVARVVPAEQRGRSRWLGGAQPMHFRLARAIRRVLAGAGAALPLTQRGTQKLEELRREHEGVTDDATLLRRDGDGVTRWWTFAGGKANRWLQQQLEAVGLAEKGTPGNLDFGLGEQSNAGTLTGVLRSLSTPEALARPIRVAEDARRSLKFAECLSSSAAEGVLSSRLADTTSIERVLSERLVMVDAREEDNRSGVRGSGN